MHLRTRLVLSISSNLHLSFSFIIKFSWFNPEFVCLPYRSSFGEVLNPTRYMTITRRLDNNLTITWVRTHGKSMVYTRLKLEASTLKLDESWFTTSLIAQLRQWLNKQDSWLASWLNSTLDCWVHWLINGLSSSVVKWKWLQGCHFLQVYFRVDMTAWHFRTDLNLTPLGYQGSLTRLVDDTQVSDPDSPKLAPVLLNFITV